MKKGILWCVIILFTLAILALFTAAFWDSIIDYLPVDQSGWLEEADGSRYYLDEKGDPITGWQTLAGQRYYFDPISGAMTTGWLELSGSRYYLDAAGSPVTGWQEIDGKRYYMDSDGSLVTGWVEDVYLNENGNPHVGWLDTEEGRCFLNSDGIRCYGWLETTEGRYYLNEDGVVATGWLQTEDGLYYLNEDGTPASGWVEIDGFRGYMNEDGTPATGWQEIDDQLYYLNSDGSINTGWLELEGNLYYLKEDGTAARGKLVIDEQTYYFTSTGANIILVNPWNYLPEDYEVELVELENGHKVSAECYDALMQMLSDCEAAGYDPYLYSSYRTQAHQQTLFNNMVVKQGGNRAKAAQIVAVPGTSEHQLGLAVDITDNTYRKLDYEQENTDTQKWLMEHSWEYGFNLRYPSSKSTITGIIYEPWHYRYVGLELAKELHDLDLCLEEYLDMLTGDGTTCGGPTD